MNTLHAQRMERFCRAGLYLVTSASLSAGRSTPDIVRAALDGGVRLIQLREKELPLRTLLSLAEDIRTLTARADALLIINDRIDVALAVGADGVHLGQDDFPLDAARRLAPELILGASTHSIEEARLAIEQGASYINIGPLFPTHTKAWSGNFLGFEGLENIAHHVTIPFTVMGGIKKEHIPELLRLGARTIAVVTAITAAPDPAEAARELLHGIRRSTHPATKT